MKIINQLENIKGVPRFVLISVSLAAVFVLVYALFCFISGGLKMILISESLCSVGVTVFAEGIILGLFGDVLITRAGR